MDPSRWRKSDKGIAVWHCFWYFVFIVICFEIFSNSHALLALIIGNARSILLAERVVLNFMQRMSGIATLTKVWDHFTECKCAVVSKTTIMAHET